MPKAKPARRNRRAKSQPLSAIRLSSGPSRRQQTTPSAITQRQVDTNQDNNERESSILSTIDVAVTKTSPVLATDTSATEAPQSSPSQVPRTTKPDEVPAANTSERSVNTAHEAATTTTDEIPSINVIQASQSGPTDDRLRQTLGHIDTKIGEQKTLIRIAEGVLDVAKACKVDDAEEAFIIYHNHWQYLQKALGVHINDGECTEPGAYREGSVAWTISKMSDVLGQLLQVVNHIPGLCDYLDKKWSKKKDDAESKMKELEEQKAEVRNQLGLD
ncbi:hypothetical protein FDECE_1917 [Fusarium decemcellulare]|nr:hypothetical protein FDECE_1917 [Fusarium decemcellulare]